MGATGAREDRRCEILDGSSTSDLCTVDRHACHIAHLGTGGNGRAAVDFRPVLGQLPRPSAAGAGLRFRGRECGRVRPVVIASVSQASFAALGTTAIVLVADGSALSIARSEAERVAAEVDRACSRFRDDSDLVRVNAHPNEEVVVSLWLLDALDVAMHGARATGGLVDPTVGAAVREIGYDRDFAQLDPDGPALHVRVRRVPGWHRVDIDRVRRTVRVPDGVEIDLGATAKAWCADCAAHAAARRARSGVVVGLGGDLACAGEAPEGGWRVRVADDHRAPIDAPGQTVTITGGGLATSGTSVRRWSRGGRRMHHVVDPSSSQPAAEYWRTVSVVAGSCADANIASTASIVLGADAPDWLAARSLPARLVGIDGGVTVVGGWPHE
jgi:FAD:protein FMN transferase